MFFLANRVITIRNSCGMVVEMHEFQHGVRMCVPVGGTDMIEDRCSRLRLEILHLPVGSGPLSLVALLEVRFLSF